MLQKPKTKFGYARRIFALPVLFSVAFAYLVNAKNKEIEKNNLAIEKAVFQSVKGTIKDTASPGKPKDTMISRKIRKFGDEKKIADLSKKIEEKSKALKTLKPESKEFEKKINEIGDLSEKIGKIANSDDFIKRSMTIRMNGKDTNINDFFKSEEWKKQIKELENMNIEIPEMNFEFDAPPSPPVPNSPKTPKVKVYTFKGLQDMKWTPESEVDYRSAKKATESAATAKKRAELDRKRAKLEEKRAKLEGERAKLEAERRVLEGNNRNVYFYKGANFNNRGTEAPHIFMYADHIRKDNNGNITMNGVKNFRYDGDDMKIYINGKESTKEEMKALKPDEIASVHVNKSSDNGKVSGEIKVQTKK